MKLISHIHPPFCRTWFPCSLSLILNLEAIQALVSYTKSIYGIATLHNKACRKSFVFICGSNDPKKYNLSIDLSCLWVILTRNWAVSIEQMLPKNGQPSHLFVVSSLSWSNDSIIIWNNLIIFNTQFQYGLYFHSRFLKPRGI